MVCILNFLQGLITFENVTSAECSMKGGGGGGGGGGRGGGGGGGGGGGES